MHMNPKPKFRDSDIAKLPLCKKVFGGLIFLFPVGFYVPVIVLGGRFVEDKRVADLWFWVAATTCIALPFIALPFAVRLGKIITGLDKWLLLPLVWLLTFVPFFGIIGYVQLYKQTAGLVGVPMGAPPRKPDIRLCTCGKAMLLTSVRQWSKGGTAIGFEGFYKCQKCGKVVVIPSTYWQMQQLLGCGGCGLIALTGIFVFSQKGIENPFTALIVGAIGCLAIYMAWQFVRGIQNRRRYPVVKCTFEPPTQEL